MRVCVCVGGGWVVISVYVCVRFSVISSIGFVLQIHHVQSVIFILKSTSTVYVIVIIITTIITTTTITISIIVFSVSIGVFIISIDN